MSKALQSKVVSDAIEAPTFTVKMARDGFGDLDAAVASVLAEKSAVDKGAGHVMWNAALLTYNILEVNKSDYIGADKAWKDQTDYILKIGFKSKGYATTLKRLGRAAVVHGVKQGSTEWAFLASNAQMAAVGKAIALDDTAEFRAAIKGYRAEMESKGAITASARTPQVPDGSETAETETETEAPASEAREATLDDILAALDAMLKGADRETFAAAESRINRIMEREILVRSKGDNGK